MKRDLRRRLLALVLFAVLVWYTVISPSYTPAPLRDAAPPDAEGREAEAGIGAGLPSLGVVRPAGPRPGEFETSNREGEEEGELDWPEIIGGD